MPADSTLTRERAPLFIGLNPRAGSGDKREARAAVAAVLGEQGHPYEIHEPARREPIDALMARLARAAAARGGVLVAAGGDGTTNAAANAARDAGVALGLLPMGTFNLLAREHGVSLEPAEAARVLAAGVTRPIALGELNGRLFFNHASFGMYTRLIRRRERAKQRFGRRRLVAALASVASLLERPTPFTIQTVTDGVAALHVTTGVFVASNRYQLEQLGLEAAICKDAGALAVLMLRPTHAAQRLRLLLRTALRRLDEDEQLWSFCANDFEVRSRRPRVVIVVDGEAARLAPPLRFRSVPEALRLVVPAAPR